MPDSNKPAEEKKAALPTQDMIVVDKPAKPCKCMKKGKVWYCMKPHSSGGWVFSDGPFESEEHCINKAKCR